MSNKHLVTKIFTVGLLVFGASGLLAQDYPTKPIRIVTAAPGGGNDLTARLIAQGISGPLGQPVIVENRPGNLSTEIVSRAPADGYTLLIDAGSFWVEPLLRKTPYDALRDFSPVTFAAGAPNVLAVQPSLAVDSVKELIALAKAKPGQINYSAPSVGSIQHLAAELLKAAAGVNIVQVNYKNSAAAVTAVAGGEAQMSLATPGVVMPHVKSGRVKALAVSSLQPSALAPGLPTIAASLPGFEAMSVYCVFIPSKTPVAIINRLNREMVRFLNTPEARAQYLRAGLEPMGSSPEETAKQIKAEVVKWGKLIKDTGIKAE